MSDSLWPHESQHARPPCPSPTPGVYSDSCPSSWWCHSAISFSVVPFSSCPQSLPASESFPISQLFAWGGQSIGVSVSEEESEKVGLKLNIQKTKIMASSPITSWEIDGEPVETVSDFILGDSKITADGDCSHEIKRCLLLGRKVITNLDSIFKSRDIALPTKVHLVRLCFFHCHVWMWELDCEESWAPKNWCFWTVVLEKTLESPLDCKEIQPVHPKGNQSWVFLLC